MVRNFKFSSKTKKNLEEPKKNEEVAEPKKDYSFLPELKPKYVEPKIEPKPIVPNATSPVVNVEKTEKVHKYNYTTYFECPVCHKKITNRQALKTHLRLKHNIIE